MAIKRVDGVDEAEVSYEAGSAIVTFNPTMTDPAAFIAELTRLTGFTAVVGTMREGKMAPPVADSTPQGRDTITVRD